MSARELLVEVGVEELPANDVARSAQALATALATAVAELGLGGGAPRVFATPRRLAALVPDVAPRQAVGEKEVRGPSRDRAYDAEGRPTPALLGFCRGQGIDPSQVETAGNYVVARVATGGGEAAQILPAAIEAAVAGLPFHRFMRWGEGAIRFGRPVVWLVALLGDEVVPVAFAGVTSGRESRGHRFLAPGPVALGAAADYAARLRDAFVLADRDARRTAIEGRLGEACRAEGLVADAEPALVEEITDLVEWPTPFVGRFDARFLALPDAVLTTTMVHHQRYLPTREAGGARASAFVAVRNGDDRRLDLVRSGNEKVLTARLDDALFFFQRDRERSLDDLRRALGGMEVGAGLGTMLDRADRVAAVVRYLAGAAGGDAAQVLVRAGDLALVDRASQVVGELPELAGEMGAVYARAAGESEAVCEALAEGVHPRDADDGLPSGRAGRLLALALRAEELVSGWAAGRAPTGSEDPYGLRRAALSVARVGMAGDLPGGLDALVAAAGATLSGRFEAQALTAAVAAVVGFVRDRVAGLLAEAGVGAAVAQAVCAAGVDPMAGVARRAQALERMLAGEEADLLLTAYRRAARLVAQAGAQGPDAPEPAGGSGAAHADPAEAALDRTLGEAEARTAQALRDDDPSAYFATVASLARPLDAFFSAVMVMDPDPAVRARRLELLRRVVGLASAVADLSGIGRRREEASVS